MLSISSLVRQRGPLTRAALLVSTLSLSACLDNSVDPGGNVIPAGPDTLPFNQPNLYPEGLEFDTNNGRFLVSSETNGSIGQVRGDGYSSFATDGRLISSVGLQIDELRNRLLVAVADPGYNLDRTSAATKNKLAALASFDNLGRTLDFVDLGRLRPGVNHFANDVAVDGNGNAYITDSFAPIIYKVDAVGVASVFLEDERLRAPADKFGLNGIEYHPDGYLLVAKSDDGSLFKVPVAAPTTFTKVAISQNLVGLDGLSLQDLNTVYAVTNTQAKVYRLVTTNAFADATVTGTFATLPQYPTTLARRNDAETYVLYSNLNALQAQKTPPVADYTIAKLKF
ncbi:hypothetical protein [Hymenobacter chitinivorans]|uniref:Sugar lactone lactonase YvrE n=1 Tax=Hymenobacter chitinivorans DSM 11115 TaxID=1121954 RepID=A0A2M9BT94_9BACT|nr:hypothetical protein [Hymenobacter chitinivorans]PJJ61180.1 hypothetical protein CLV45_2618 [Hymenobacter chitinivorans DSM 11115]